MSSRAVLRVGTSLGAATLWNYGRPGPEQRPRTVLGELLGHMEGAQGVASGIAREYPEYEAMAQAVRSATEMVAIACELEAYGERESDD